MIGLIFMAAGAAISAYSMYQQGENADAMADYNASVANLEAEAQARALEAEGRHLARGDRAEMGALRTNMAGRGVNYESGSPMLIAAELARENQYDQMEMKRKADISREYGAASGRMLKFEGQSAKKASILSATGTVVGGLGTMAGSYEGRKWINGE